MQDVWCQKGDSPWHTKAVGLPSLLPAHHSEGALLGPHSNMWTLVLSSWG